MVNSRWEPKDGEEVVLSSRDVQTLEFIAEGLTTAEMSKRVGARTDSAMKSRVAKVIGRLGCSSRTEALAEAYLRDLIDTPRTRALRQELAEAQATIRLLTRAASAPSWLDTGQGRL
jgi:DNA-binding CsgD family transcriptional regulator